MINFIFNYKNGLINSEYYKTIINRGYSVNLLYYREKQPLLHNSKLKWIYIWIIGFFKMISNLKVLKKNATYLQGLHYSLFLIGRFSSKINENIIVDNFYIHELGQKKIFKLILSFLLFDKKYQLIVHSLDDVEYFSNISSSLKITFIPYCMGKINYYSDISFKKELPKNFFFSGGYTNRDYDLLIRVAKKFPNHYFVLVISKLNIIHEENQKNVIIFKDIESIQFNSIAAKSSCIIIPLKSHVGASGQALCLIGMQLGKTIIYTDDSSLNQYFKFKNGISYEINNADSLEASINEFLNNTQEQLLKLEENQIKIFDENFSIRIRNNQITNIIEESILQIKNN